MIHCCFLLSWSPLSQLQLPPGLPVALQELGAHDPAVMPGGWQWKNQMPSSA